MSWEEEQQKPLAEMTGKELVKELGSCYTGLAIAVNTRADRGRSIADRIRAVSAEIIRRIDGKS